MTEIENAPQAKAKAKEYLVDPIGVTQEVVDNGDLYEFDEVELKPSTEGDAYKILMTGEWDGDFLDLMQIHIRKSDGALLFWRNLDVETGGAIGWQISKKYWIGD